MIFLSKELQDEYVNMLARGSKSVSISYEQFDYSASTEPLVLRGILKKKLMKQ